MANQIAVLYQLAATLAQEGRKAEYAAVNQAIELLFNLREWDAYMGGFEGGAWERLRDFLGSTETVGEV